MRRRWDRTRTFGPGRGSARDRKSTRLNPVTNRHLVCRLLLEKKHAGGPTGGGGERHPGGGWAAPGDAQDPRLGWLVRVLGGVPSRRRDGGDRERLGGAT